MKNLLLLLASSGILLAGCKQFKIQPDKIGNRYDMLSAHSWKLVGLTESGSNVELKSCQLDDIYVFNVHGWGYMDEGASKCGVTTTPPVDTNTTNPVDTGIIVGKSTIANADNIQYDESGMRIDFNWTVVGDQRQILITDYGNPDNDPVWEVQEMDANHLKVRGSEMRDGKLIAYYKEFVTAQ